MRKSSTNFLRAILASALLISFAVSPVVTYAATVVIDNNSDFSMANIWTPDNVYIISGQRTLSAGQTLDIYSGTVVKFLSSNGYLSVYGTLNALGTSSPIYFTSYKDDRCSAEMASTTCDNNGDGSATTPAPGNWGGMSARSGGSITLENAVVAYGGSVNDSLLYNNGGTLNIASSTLASSSNSAIYNYLNGTTTIEDSIIRDNINYGIYTTADSLTMYNNRFFNNDIEAVYAYFSNGLVLTNSHNFASGNGMNGIEIGGNIYTSQTWEFDTMPYVIDSGGMSITGGRTLTIEPGSIIKFDGQSSRISIDGTLNVLSTTTTTTTLFTSLKDDDYFGLNLDTNNDGDATSPSAGDWDSIRVYTNGTADINSSLIRYGGDGSASSTGMLLNYENLSIASSTVAYSATNGIFQSGGTFEASNIDLGNNLTGLYRGGGSASINQSKIHDNTNYGIYSNSGSNVTAANNYWGDNSGPYHPTTHATGTGDTVSNYVTFNPWETNIHFVTKETTDCVYLYGECDSVAYFSSSIFMTASTTYITELSFATSTWNTYGSIQIVPSTSSLDLELEIYDLTLEEGSDQNFAGKWTNRDVLSDYIQLNPYYIEPSTAAERKNVMMHELGHALGLAHSLVGNIMYMFLSDQISFGEQDMKDYNYLWQ